MEPFNEYFKKAIKSLKIADHMTYVTFQVVNEKRLLLKIFEEIHSSINNSIDAIIYLEFIKGKLIIKSHKENIENFFRIGKNYNLTNLQLKKIKDILDLNEKHRQSALEFVKNEKVVIMSDAIKINTIDLFKIKEFLLVAKELVMNINKEVIKLKR